MKKIFFLATICGLFFACNTKNMEEKHEKKTELTILNQSSVSVKEIKYNGLSFAEVNNDKNFVLVTGGRTKISFEGKGKSYIHFTILDNVNNKEVEVRTAEVIYIEEGKDSIFTITDNTIVVRIGQTESFPIIGITKPARLKLINKTTQNIEEVTFCNKSYKTTVSKGESCFLDFSQKVSGKLKFKIMNQDKLSIDVEWKDEILIKTDETKEVIITNTSLVIKDGKTQTIRDILEMSILKVINNSTAEISNLRFAEQTKSGILEKDASWELEFYDRVEEKLEFEVKTKYKKFNVKTTENIIINKGEEISFVITNEIIVSIQEYSKSLKLTELLDVAHVIISNKSGADINATKYGNVDFGIVQNSSTKEMFFWNFADVPDYVFFSIHQASTGNSINLKTQEKFSVTKGEEKIIEIAENTVVLKEGSEILFNIGNLILENATLIIQNKSSYDLFNVTFAGKSFIKGGEAILSKNSDDSQNFQNNTSDYVTFKFANSDILIKTKEKVNLEVGEVKSYIINNDTAIIIEGHSESIKLWEFQDAKKVKIINNTQAELKKVSYLDVDFGVLPEHNGKASRVFLDFVTTSDYIRFEIHSTSLSAPIKVRTADKFSIQNEKNLEFKITDETRVIKEGDSEELKIKSILGISTLNIVNKTSAINISKLRYAGEEYGKVIEKDESLKMEFDGEIEDFLEFTVAIKVVDEVEFFACKIKNKISLAKGEEKNIILSNSTDIICAGHSETIKIQNLLNAAKLRIVNNTSINLLNVKYNGSNINVLESNHAKSTTYLNYPQTPSAISFEMQTSDGIVKVNTKELISLISGKVVTYEITNTTIVLKVGGGGEASFKSVLGISTLKVINKTLAKELKNLSYADKTYEGNLPKNSTWEVEFDSSTDDYIKFIVETNLSSFNIKTKEKIIIAKGEEKSITLTNDTEVIVEGSVEPTKIVSLLNASKVKIENRTSIDLLNITHNDFSINMLKSNYVYTAICWGFGQTPSAITFEMQTPDGIVKVKTKDFISLQSAKTITYIITNKTIVVKDGSGLEASFKSVLGISTLTVINQTSAKEIKNLRYANKNYDYELSKDESWEVEFNDATNDYLSFIVKTEMHEFNIKTSEKIVIAKGGEKTIILTDETNILVEGDDKPTKIDSILYAAILKVINNTSAVLVNITYDNFTFKGEMPSNYQDWAIYWDYSNIPSNIILEIQTQNGLIKAKTKDFVSLVSNQTFTYTFTDNTIVIKDGTNEETSIKGLLGISTLKVINQTSAKEIKNLSYAGKKHKGALAKNASWEVEFNDSTNDCLVFVVVTELRELVVETLEKIVIAKGSEKTVTLMDSTNIYGGFIIEDILDSAVLVIENYSSTNLLNTTYQDEIDDEILPPNYTLTMNFVVNNVPSKIIFSIQTSKGLIKVETKDFILLKKRKKYTYEITDDTYVIVNGSTNAVRLKSLL